MHALTASDLKELRSLHSREGRSQYNAFLVEGEKNVEELISSGWEIKKCMTTKRFLDAHPHFIIPGEVSIATPEQYARLTELDTPPEISAVVTRRYSTLLDIADSPFILCCDGVSDPGNLGTIIRTADWFGVSAILLSRQGVDPFSSKVVRATMGSLFRTKLCVSNAIIDDLTILKGKGIHIVVADALGETLVSSPQLPKPLCLVLGSEAHGAHDEIKALSHQLLAIPGADTAESLNVAVSAGILLYALHAS